MQTRRGKIWLNIDWICIALYLLLVFAGWVNIYAAVYDESHTSIFDTSMRYGKQLIWIAAAFIIGFFVFLIDSKFYSAFSYVIFVFFMLLLIAVLLFGTEINNSRSWFQIGDFRLQPSEFAKMATSLALAQFASRTHFSLNNLKDVLGTILIIGLPIGLIVLQNDAGSALIYSSLIFVLYREGLNNTLFVLFFAAIALFVFALVSNQLIIMTVLVLAAILYFIFTSRKRWYGYWGLLVFAVFAAAAILVQYFGIWPYPLKYLILSAVVLSIGVSLLIALLKKIDKAASVLVILLAASLYVYSVDFVYSNLLEKHQQERIGELLGFNSDPLGAGYNVNQSKISIGSGGLLGKGFLQGTQTKYNFVPEQDTDFIFCTVGEEWGFAGSMIVLMLFAFLIIRIIWLAERQRSAYSRIYGYSVASFLFIHVAINIGMTIGLAPVIGIPLPFFSYGGSSLWAFTMLLMIFLRIDANRMEVFR
ncbi:MAG TPA: rod shape-determining protein RodA [Bacteroidales bacterium]|nr:rod shape-determining protein RodA [Bacteroidales bacterium]